MNSIFARYGLGGFLRDAAGDGGGGGAQQQATQQGAQQSGAQQTAQQGTQQQGTQQTTQQGSQQTTQQSGNPASGGEWYGAAEFGFDDKTREFFAGKKYPDVKTALASLPQADKMARDRNVIAKPDPAKLQEWDGFTELGWTPEYEKFAKGVKKPDAKNLNENVFNATLKAAHKHKIAPWQAEGLYNDVLAEMGQAQAAQETAAAGELAKLETSLRQEWGADFERNKELSSRAMKHFGIGAQDAKHLDAALGSPGMVKMFQQIGELMGEDRLVLPNDSGGALPASIDGLKAEVAKLHGDEAFMKKFRDSRHPEHKSAVDQRARVLARLAAAEDKAAKLT